MAERSCNKHHVFILICNAVMTEEVKPKAAKKPATSANKKATTPEMTTAPVAATGKVVPVALDFNDRSPKEKTFKWILRNYLL